MLKLLLVVTLLSFVNFSAFALGGGVPTFDATALAQAIELIKRADSQIKQLEEQVNTAKSQLDAYKQEVIDTKKRFEGFSDYSAIFGSAEAYIQNFWSDLNRDLSKGDIRQLATKYGFDISEYEQIERQYKAQFEQVKKYETLEGNIKRSSQSLINAQKAFAQSKNPQQREELQNNIVLESTLLQAQIAQTNAEIQKIEKEEKLKHEAALKHYLNETFSTKLG